MRLFAIAALFTLFSGCASRPASMREADLIHPEIRLIQLAGPAENGYLRGPVSLRYRIIIANKSDEPITFRSLELRNIGSGSYVVDSRPVHFKETIPPGGFNDAVFFVNGYARGGILNSDEPVMLRGIAHFDTPLGPMNHVFMQRLDQFNGGSEH